MILAIETSCDDTCAAVVEPLGSGARALSNVVHTQTEHGRYGGVVPEVASRAHLERLDGVVERALSEAGVGLEEVEKVAVTTNPGLIGALLVGVSAAKGLAYSRGLPLVAVDHLEGHVAAAYLTEPDLEPPFVAGIASGGHTALYAVDERRGMEGLGATLDDAAGEALDKGARMLGLGFPGGPALSEAGREGDPAAYDFPVALKGRDDLNFSFSGLKTSLLYRLKGLYAEAVAAELPDLAASYESAVVEALVRKMVRAAELREARSLVVAGGVAANARLRRRLGEECERRSLGLVVPPSALCTDNAAMIGAAALYTPALAHPDYLSVSARSA
ncbi:tRNA (adenosine(37)-N6)-threonylcarbamoyltransferase complex transferase subunit TsaD [Rubrobacter aplysinae]|uniref:tRNA (adenosine(37)-N6)-threonylcarbamoyltransferase complex transferase subunit TsaD n=1 Tax=Rubrobacter aplysinae TaxID=909625 RepID=UPI00064BD260|nr:tRNA (adenosine(37)-N6)-threonylcarbamoyltransferase complex transferase subunit TsaD [Rubrobacter aplysinae]